MSDDYGPFSDSPRLEAAKEAIIGMPASMTETGALWVIPISRPYARGIAAAALRAADDAADAGAGWVRLQLNDELRLAIKMAVQGHWFSPTDDVVEAVVAALRDRAGQQ